jgi:putative phosphonate metabolism protein
MDTNLARYALYFTPPPDSDLARIGSSILGYDCYAGATVPQAPLENIDPDEVEAGTAEPRRYGFHGTLKAPFRLHPKHDLDELKTALRDFAAERPAFDAGTLSPRTLGRFIALTPDTPSLELALLAAECVAAFDRFRVPVTEEDRQRRARNNLTARQAALLERWGYPYVFDEFRFHMTLTGPLPEERRDPWLESLATCVGGPKTLIVDALTLLEQTGPSARFRVVARYEFKGRSATA